MAIDQALLDRAEQRGESWLRLYQWEPHCLSFGRHEPATRRYDVERITQLGLDTVRRPTGGRAVWHGKELTYALAAPSIRFGSLAAAYQEIHRMLAVALEKLGAQVSLAASGRVTALDAGACFAQPAGGEIMMEGRKVVGSAQYRQGAALLQHGSILLQDEQSIVLGLTRGSRTVVQDATGKTEPESWLGKLADWRQLAEVIMDAAAHRWPGSWSRDDNPAGVLQAASHYHPRYRSAAWTWAR